MEHHNLIFITTFINIEKIEILLHSLACNNSIKLKVILVAQNGISIDIDRYESDYNSFSVIQCLNQMSLSKARNMGIDYVLSNEIEADYVMFPDDDSSFDLTFFERFIACTSNGTPLIIDVCNENSKDKYIKHTLKDGAILYRKHYYAVGSTNMIIPFDLFVSTGHFDEQMGVGAQYGAGEDGDYFIRSLKCVGQFVYSSKLYNFHPKAEVKYNELTYSQTVYRYKSYGVGVAYLFHKHKMHSDSFLLCVKALVASLIHLVRFNFKMAAVCFCAFGYRSKAVLKFAVRGEYIY